MPQGNLPAAECLFIAQSPQQAEQTYKIYASSIPPIAENALVLQRSTGQDYRVVPFKDIACDVHKHRQELLPKQVVLNQQTGALRLEGLALDSSKPFLIIKGPQSCTSNALVFNAQHGIENVCFYNQANQEMDRITYFWSFDDDTRVNYLRPSPLDGALSSLFIADYRSYQIGRT